MVVMTAKVSKSKLIAIVCLLAAIVCITLVVISGNGSDKPAEPEADVSTNEGRIQWLASYSWTVDAQPADVQQVRIPAEADEVFSRYNELQKSQGYDLTRFAGKEITRYVYRIVNYAGTAEPVYAALLIHNGEVIGGDITVTGTPGCMHGFSMPEKATPIAAETVETEPAAAEGAEPAAAEQAEPAAAAETQEEAA